MCRKNCHLPHYNPAPVGDLEGSGARQGDALARESLGLADVGGGREGRADAGGKRGARHGSGRRGRVRVRVRQREISRGKAGRGEARREMRVLERAGARVMRGMRGAREARGRG